MTAEERYLVWLEQSGYDLEASKLSLKEGFFEWSCYQSIQSVEKSLKAVIVQSGERPPKIHKLGILVSMCNHVNKAFFEVKFNFRKLESYTFISRYPFVNPEHNLSPHNFIKKIDAEACINQAIEINQKINEFLKSKQFKKGEPLNLLDIYFTEAEIQNRIKEVINSVKSSNQLQPQKIILFGGFAREGTRPKTSTMDILIIAQTKLPFFERIEHVREITKGNTPIIEPLVYTKEEFDFLIKEEGEGFLESAIEEGRVVWEKLASPLLEIS